MNKANVITAFSEKNGVSIKKATIAVNSVFEIISESLCSGTDVSFANFGVFKVRQRKATVGRNPQTGAAINITARRVTQFTAYTALKEQLNK